tara:strand:+ start:1262 stop:1762 length:501 start_codon:yes stop_codon:yes gene_type:complete
MNIYLLRHGEAEPRAASDSQRRLTEKGEADIQDIARQFSQHHPVLNRCVCSPYLRARQSAELFLKSSGLRCPIQEDSVLTPEKPATELMQFLYRLEEENILLAGHNPQLTALFALLTHGETDHRMKILAAGELCAIAFETFAEGLGECRFSLLPHSKQPAARLSGQ